MTQMIAIDASALDAVMVRLESIERKLEAVMILPKPEWISIAAYAKQINRHPRTVKRMIESGEIEARGSGHNRMVRVSP